MSQPQKPNFDISCNRTSFGEKGFKYLTGYTNYYEKVMPLCIMLPERVHIEKINICLNICLN